MSYISRIAISPKLALFKLTNDTTWVNDQTLPLSLVTDFNLISGGHCSLLNNIITLNTGSYFFEFRGSGTRASSTAISLNIKKDGVVYTDSSNYSKASYDAITDVKRTVKTAGFLKENVNGSNEFTLVSTGTSATTTLNNEYTYVLIWRL